MTELDPRILEILKALIFHTQAGNVQWQTTDDEEKFIYSGSRSSIVVDSATNRTPQPYWFQILNQRGVVIEEVETSDDDPSISTDLNNAVIRLYGLAARSALQVDVAIDSVLKELNELPPF